MPEKLVIQNFGLFWERDQIHWGVKGEPGHLKGFISIHSGEVDFRTQRGIYVLYEGRDIASQRVSYIGQAGAGAHDLFARLSDHNRGSLWNRWQRFSWFGFLEVGKKNNLLHSKKAAVGNISLPVALDQFEAVLIALFEPLKNKQGPTWHQATEYYQVLKKLP